MNMHFFDWMIVGGVFLIIASIALYSRQYLRSVADFISANRCAGRYLLVGAELMAAVSATQFVAKTEQCYVQGFPVNWWMIFIGLFALIKALSGWVLYRFRETRAMTLSQFFEIRYSRKLRIFSGAICWLSGVANYTIHPAVTSRLLVYFCGLPLTVDVFGFEIRTIVLVMFVMISIATFLTLSGGQIALMVTDFFQGQLMLVASLAVILFVFCNFDWAVVMETLKAAPEGQSMLNPFDQAGLSGFNIWFFVILGFLMFYNELTFQGNMGYYGAAKNPHEAKMSRIVATWRWLLPTLLYLVVAIVAYVIFNSASYSADAAVIQGSLDGLSDKWLQSQMRIPMTLVYLLPTGLMGLLVAMFIASSLSTDDTYLHAWGSILVQDVLLPLRKKERLSTKEHLKWLRISVILVAVIAFIAGSFIPFRDFVVMYFYITAAIFSAGAGAAIIGGLYWKKGTTAGAWSALVTGAFFATTGFVLRIVWTDVPALVNLAAECPLNGLQMTFLVSVISSLVYVIVSLFDRKEPFNLERMLHRGQYAIAGEHAVVQEDISLWRKLTGIGREFSRKDKILAWIATGWILSWILIALVGTIYYALSGGGISDDVWGIFWLAFLIIYFLVGFVVFCWYLIGGTRDVIDLFKTLKSIARNDGDDGTVIDHQSLAGAKRVDPILSRESCENEK